MPLSRDLGFRPPAAAGYQTFITGHFPLDDPRYNPNLEPTGACISNMTIFSAWLDNAALIGLWAGGAGRDPDEVIQDPNVVDQWCSEAPNWQQTRGSKAGLIIHHHGALWDGIGDKILDGEGKFIHGIS